MKKIRLFVLTILMVFTMGGPSAMASDRIDASAAIMVDASTGQVIYQQNANKKLPVASISKLLTVLVIEDEIQQKQLSWNTQVKITPEVAAISNDPAYSSIGLKEGQSYSVRMLVNAMLVKSADGAAAALASATGDGTDEFNLKLTNKANKLGIHDITIVNAIGLTNGDLKDLKIADIPSTAENSMSARDVAIISQYLVKHYPELLQITAEKQAKYQISKGNVKTEQNLNKMLPGSKYTVKGVKIDGLKTGTSDAAGASFASTGTYHGHRIITVVLHANGANKDNRFVATQQLYKILKNEEHLQPIKIPASATTRKVSNGAERTMNITPHQVTIWTPYDTETNYTIGTQYNKSLMNKKGYFEAPIWKGKQVGQLRISSKQIQTLNDEPLTYPLYNSKDIQRGNLWQRLWH